MKKMLFLILASFLVLAACGQEESKSEDKKETKSSKKESKKDNKKKDVADKKSNEKVASQDKDTDQSVQSQEQVNTQEQQITQQPIESQKQVVNEQNGFTSGPTEENPANLNRNEEQNTNMKGEHVVSPGWTQDEQSAAYEEYKKGKQAQAAAGPSAVPGAGLMNLDE